MQLGQDRNSAHELTEPATRMGGERFLGTDCGSMILQSKSVSIPSDLDRRVSCPPDLLSS
jgi:hypothetical protein